MLRIGLTGGAGAGKSTVARALAARGFPVIDADKVAHGLYLPGSAVVRDLAAAFGEDVLDPYGGIDRRVLGKRAFGDPEALARLDAIVHPPLRAELRRRLRELEEGGAEAAVVEAALLLRWRPLDLVDVVVGVSAPRALRRRRLLAAGLAPEDAGRRLDAQVEDAVLARDSHILIVNDGSPEALEARVEVAAAELRRLASRRPS